jgi:prepilin-type processing-associated H-X9-DG protein
MQMRGYFFYTPQTPPTRYNSPTNAEGDSPMKRSRPAKTTVLIALLSALIFAPVTASRSRAATTAPSPQEQKDLATREHNLRMLYNVFLLYAQDHNGTTPPDLAALAASPYAKAEYFVYPDSEKIPPTDLPVDLKVAWILTNSDDTYTPRTLHNPGSSILISENNPPHGTVAFVLHLDGSINPPLPAVAHPADARATDARTLCQRNLRQIGQGILLYTNENRGNYPPDLGTLAAQEDLTASDFVCPATADVAPAHLPPDQIAKWVNDHSDYIYTGAGLKQGDNPAIVVAYDKEANHHGDGLNLLFADGHVEFQNMTQAKKTLDASRKLH